jgi:hypothetical protein
LRQGHLHVSQICNQILAAKGVSNLLHHRHRHQEYDIEDRPVDPITGGAIAFLGSFGDITYETFNLPVQIARGIVTGTTKIVKKLDSSHGRHKMENEPEREETLSQRCTIAPIQTHSKIRENEYPDSWKDIFSQSLEVISTTGKGMGRLSKAGLSLPLHFSLGIARGFQ